MNTMGLITIPAEQPKSKARWCYEFHLGVINQNGYYKCCWLDNHSGLVSEPWVVITDVFGID